MLNFRLEELNDVVDYFIIVEANCTFKGSSKPLTFNINKYEKFKDKIIYKVCELPPELDAWQNETNQRCYLKEGLKDLQIKGGDLILISDVDEIPDIKDLVFYKNNGINEARTFYQNFYYYNYKCRNIKKWSGSVLLSAFIFKTQFNANCETVRKSRWGLPLIGDNYESGGWHFSYFGDTDYIINKIQSFSHQEYNNEKYTNPDSIKKLIESGKDLFFRSDEKFEILKFQKYLPKHIHLLD